MKQVVTALVLVLLVVLQSAGQDLCCLRTQEASVGRGADEATVYPANAKVVKAVGEAAEKEASAKTKVIIGKCTRVSDGDTIHVVTDGNVKFKVRLDRIDAPEKDQPHGKESTAYLTKLIKGRSVRVEWQKKDKYGRVLGMKNFCTLAKRVILPRYFAIFETHAWFSAPNYDIISAFLR